MHRAIPVALATLLMGGLLLTSPQAAKKALRCTLTNTKIERCCCEQREKKLYCPLANKTVEKCCREPAGETQSTKTT